MKIIRHKLGNGVNCGIRHTHCPAYISYSRLCCKSTESNDLSHMVCAVFLRYIIYNFTSSYITKINVKVRHRHPFRVQKSFKKKIIFHRVKVRNFHTICRNRAGTRTSAGTYGNTFAFGKRNKIGYNKIVVGIAHFFNRFKLIVKAVVILFRRIFAVPFFHTLLAKHFEIFKMVHIIRRLVIRQFGVTELKIKVAHIADNLGIVYRFGRVGKNLPHLLFRFKIKFICVKFKPCIVAYCFVGIDTNKHLLNFSVLLFNIMHIVGGNERYTRFTINSL